MTDRFLVCNIGRMEFYDGLGKGDTIHGGGRFIQKKKWGNEIYNFRAHQGCLYGGTFPNPNETINVNNLGALPDDAKVDGVTVIWTAPSRDSGGTYVVGWYKNATVHREEQRAPKGSNRPVPKNRRESCGYYVATKAKDGTLLESDLRTLPVPRGTGGMGMANVWFPHRTPQGRRFLHKLKAFLRNSEQPSRKKSKDMAKRQPDLERRQRIELAAMNYTTSWYDSIGYKVDPVHKQNLGWDLEAKHKSKNNGALLLLEVKGLSGNDITIELTPNEYAQMQNHKENYRICVVTRADSRRTRELHRFSYSVEQNGWIDQDSKKLQVTEVTGARAIAH